MFDSGNMLKLSESSLLTDQICSMGESGIWDDGFWFSQLEKKKEFHFPEMKKIVGSM